MDDGDSKTHSKIKKKRASNSNTKGRIFDASLIFQSLWFRCRSVFPNITDRKFMESELRFVLYCGILFWALHLLYQIIK